MPGFDDSYFGKLKQLVGDFEVIVPSARAVIRREHDEILLIRRGDNQQWGLPAGSLELGESIYACMVREVYEETGLTVEQAVPFAVYSDPRFGFQTPYGRYHHTFAIAFLVQRWTGTLLVHTDETLDARFFSVTGLPQLAFQYGEVIDDAMAFTGEFLCK